MTESGPSRNPSFFKWILLFRGPRRKKAQPGGEAAFAAACAIGFYVSLDAQKRIKQKKLGFGVNLRDPTTRGVHII
jgi:hypothetical protein